MRSDRILNRSVNLASLGCRKVRPPEPASDANEVSERVRFKSGRRYILIFVLYIRIAADFGGVASKSLDVI